MPEQILDISWETILRVLITCFLFYILFLVRDVVILFFFALIISILVDPAINFFVWLRIPKIIATILIYLSVFVLVGLIVYLVSPIFVFELNQLAHNMPSYFEKLNPYLRDAGLGATQNFEEFTSDMILKLQQSSASIFLAVSTLFGGIISTFLIFSMAFFISLEDKSVEKVVSLMAPKKYEGYVAALFERVQYKVSGWFGARVLACLLVGIASYIAFYVLGVKYAFILALISGVLNFIPYIGPTITMILSVLFVGISSSWIAAIYVLVVLLIIQEIENKALTPLLMKKFIDLPPVLVLLSLLVGGALFGFLGTIFIVPVAGVIYEFLKEFLEKRRNEEYAY